MTGFLLVPPGFCKCIGFALFRHTFEQLVTKNNGNPYTKQSARLKKFFCTIITDTYIPMLGLF